jgi:hypothetical protein
MKYKNFITGISLAIILTGCEKYWDEHYGTKPETVNINLWDAVQKEINLTSFVQYIKEYKYDTLFLKNDGYTLFIPDNDAFSQFLDTGQVTSSILDYLISVHVIQSGSINGKRKIQTLAEKFALFERYTGIALLDGIPLNFESPLYLNGKYFVMNQVALPKPNLYEYYTANNPILKTYIDSKDSIILDKEKSRPIGFDEFGNTIYDTVSEIYNEFEVEFFPVREEFRNKSATIVFPKEDDYNTALTEMAQSLGGTYIDYNDIPLGWQNKVLIPYLLEYGVFENLLEEHDFVKKHPDDPLDTLKLKNILGDSIVIDYQPAEKAICSNGYAYNYTDFTIPDTLFSGSTKLEGEWLLDRTGENKFFWNEFVRYNSTITYEPIRELIKTENYNASNDSILRVSFAKGYTGTYTIEFNAYSFKAENLIPRKYLMVVSTHMDVGGIYNIYINDELVTTFDYYTFIRLRGLNWSVTGARYLPQGRFNKFDCWVENISEYGKAMIKFEYVGPGTMVLSNGLVIDYIEFIPYN